MMFKVLYIYKNEVRVEQYFNLCDAIKFIEGQNSVPGTINAQIMVPLGTVTNMLPEDDGTIKNGQAYTLLWAFKKYRRDEKRVLMTMAFNNLNDLHKYAQALSNDPETSSCIEILVPLAMTVNAVPTVVHKEEAKIVNMVIS